MLWWNSRFWFPSQGQDLKTGLRGALGFSTVFSDQKICRVFYQKFSQEIPLRLFLTLESIIVYDLVVAVGCTPQLPAMRRLRLKSFEE